MYDLTSTNMAVFKLGKYKWEQAVVLDDQDVVNFEQDDLAPFYTKLELETGCNFNDGKWILIKCGGPDVELGKQI
jgi:hypothetical protein|tara:strand:- start:849 stop:1073 length:225 start_codon:yes stop_codon:yes gene_type:complete